MRYLLVILLACTSPVFGIKDAAGPDGVNAYAVRELGITGQGVSIALLSNGNVRSGHAAFTRADASAVFNHDFTGSGLSRSAHDTQMAGILVSNGSAAQPEHIGIAPGAKVHSARISALGVQANVFAKALDELITQHNCRIIMTGVQLPADIVTPDGNSFWSKLFDYYAETYDVIFANASGNLAPQITVFGDAYNGITTAGLVNEQGAFEKAGSASNKGPSADGRKKPEIAAPTHALLVPNSTGDDLWAAVDPAGSGLTSFAVPQTAGVAALLLEAAAKSRFENADRSLVIKAVIVNSAGTLENRHWDAATGYGRLNALAAYQTLTAGPLTKEKPAKQAKGWAYDQMQMSGEHVYKIEAAKDQRLRTTATWHRKLLRTGTTLIEEPTRFHLVLKIISPSGLTIELETPGRDNLIKLDTRLKESGTYQIILTNPTLAAGRTYAFAFELLD